MRGEQLPLSIHLMMIALRRQQRHHLAPILLLVTHTILEREPNVLCRNPCTQKVLLEFLSKGTLFGYHEMALL